MICQWVFNKKFYFFVELEVFVYGGWREALKKFKKKINKKPVDWSKNLSDGEQKRIAFINILHKVRTQKPKFLVLDEPLKGVDETKQKVMVKLLKKHRPKGCTVLFTNHEQNHGPNIFKCDYCF